MPAADVSKKSNGIKFISTIAHIDIIDQSKGLGGIIALAKAWSLSQKVVVDFCGLLDSDKFACSAAKNWAKAFRNENADLKNDIISKLSEAVSNVPYAICTYTLLKLKCLTLNL
jgi:hypothetical protein